MVRFGARVLRGLDGARADILCLHVRTRPAAGKQQSERRKQCARA